MPFEREGTCVLPEQTVDDFGRQVLRDGDVAVNIRTGKLFKSIVKGIYHDVRSAFTPDVNQQVPSEKQTHSATAGSIARRRQ